MSSENHPLVSVIIPSYNHAQYLEESVSSVIKSEYPSLEIIIVNDGSTDDTSTVAKKIVAESKVVQYLEQKNQGVETATNTGIKASSGK